MVFVVSVKEPVCPDSVLIILQQRIWLIACLFVGERFLSAEVYVDL